jgi:hypothetical protein
MLRSALLAILLSTVASLGCSKAECHSADLQTKDCKCADGADGKQACVQDKWAACDCKPAGAPGQLPGVVGAGAVPGGKEVPAEFCKNNCKGVENTCKGAGIGEPGSCEREYNDCIARCPQ